nr:hypothetical protein [uncultured bacterium]|tara:strand:- start:59 stop:1105 length:1047 start_codon:yes stop_codon:yes gene_type:complete
MKIHNLLLILAFTFSLTTKAQVKLNDFGRIVLNTYLPNNLAVPSQAKKLLETKLNQITSKNGVGGSQVNGRFIITASVNIGTKDIIAGPPQMIAQNLDITLFMGDAVTNTIFSSTTLSLKGVGTNENKTFINAFKTINARNKEVLVFLEEGKTKIINYYSTQCDFIIKDAETLVKQEQYDEAIYQLSLVPEVCQDCYFKCLDKLAVIYQQKIDADCKSKFNEAKTTWLANQTPVGAEKAGDILSAINTKATCQSEITMFIKNIDAKLKADEKARWQFKMKQYADKIVMQKEQVRIAEEKGKRDDIYRENQSTRNLELDKIRTNSYREIAVEQAKNQPKTVTYNNIYWR